jgi:protein involved in polysaccharide export with SLBB domain
MIRWPHDNETICSREVNVMNYAESAAPKVSEQGRTCFRFMMLMALSMPLGLSSGCAALTNPVAIGIPVDKVPPELLAGSREGTESIPLNTLRQDPPAVYRLAPGDVMGIWIEGITAAAGQAPPVHFPERVGLRFPERSDLVPSMGLPYPVREDGKVALPMIPTLSVQDMSIEEADRAIRKAYADAKLLDPNKAQIIVTVARPRIHHVVVVRHDLPGANIAANLNTNFVVTNVGTQNGETELVGSTQGGVGQVVDLPAYENDVLTALALTGGLPASTSTNEILVYRGTKAPGDPKDKPADGHGQFVRIPLRIRAGEALPFGPSDVLLNSGDVVFVESKKMDTFYTGGLLPPGEHIMPNDYDLDVVEAVARVRGPLVSGAFNQSNLNGLIIPRGIGNPNPSLLTVLRRTPYGGHVSIRVDLNRALCGGRERITVQPGDVLILQETPTEALVRYFTNVFMFDFTSSVITGVKTKGIINTVVP